MTEPLWITEEAILDIHVQVLLRYGGASGIREQNMLRSAMARPLQHFAYGTGTDIIGLAAVLTAGIVKNHPFVDGNKRTGYLAGSIFLELNGFTLTATNAEATAAVLALAASEMDETGYAEFLRASTVPSGSGQTRPPGE